MRHSIFLAIAIAVVATGWVLSGEFGDKVGLANGKAAQGPAPSVAERNEARGEAALTAVRTKISIAKQHWRAVTARGHTEAKRKVMIKSEIKGRIIKVSVQKGQKVRRGDELVRIDVADRDAHMAEAKALVRQREVEFQAANKLRKKGYRAETQYSAAAAHLDAAHAMVKQMEVALGRTIIRAPFDAIVDSREVELGAYVKDGSGIALLVDEDPYLVVAQVSENDVGQLRRNGKGRAVLVTGQTVEGRINYIAATAELNFPTEQILAHFITPAVLTLNDSGTVGVRCVEAAGKVAFYPVNIIDSGVNGVWVEGLPEQTELIVVGQEFVRQGDRVRVVGGAKKMTAKTAEITRAPAS